jgi:hypothetical protein
VKKELSFFLAKLLLCLEISMAIFNILMHNPSRKPDIKIDKIISAQLSSMNKYQVKPNNENTIPNEPTENNNISRA